MVINSMILLITMKP